jgi:peroxiredoxin (alkyl hydroperoxide reductase subunit C)
MIEAGSLAPRFTLRNVDKTEMSLDDFKGRKTLIKFIPFPFTGTCLEEMCTIRDNLGALNDLDANVVVITTTPVPSNAAWAAENGFTVPILSDFWPHGEVTQAYGAFNEKTGGANRTTFVLDADGIVTDVIASPDLGTPREFDLYTKALAGV